MIETSHLLVLFRLLLGVEAIVFRSQARTPGVGSLLKGG